jgi:hypothetical protein
MQVAEELDVSRKVQGGIKTMGWVIGDKEAGILRIGMRDRRRALEDPTKAKT